MAEFDFVSGLVLFPHALLLSLLSLLFACSLSMSIPVPGRADPEVSGMVPIFALLRSMSDDRTPPAERARLLAQATNTYARLCGAEGRFWRVASGNLVACEGMRRFFLDVARGGAMMPGYPVVDLFGAEAYPYTVRVVAEQADWAQELPPSGFPAPELDLDLEDSSVADDRDGDRDRDRSESS